MNCWITLGIEEYSDKKAIKIAYAKLLKVTKPDDDPQGFKELHAAYKEAVNTVSANKEISSPQSFVAPNKEQKSRDINRLVEQFNVDLSGSTSVLNIKNTNRNQDADENDIVESLHEEYKNLFSRVEKNIAMPSKCYLPRDWKFIESYLSLFLDLEYRRKISDEMFQLVLNTNQTFSEEDLLIKPPVLVYLSKLFSWESQWVELNRVYDEAELNRIFPFLVTETDKEFEASIDICINEVLLDDYSIQETYPDFDLIDESEIRARVRYGLERANEFGFGFQCDRSINDNRHHFAALMWRVGPHFYLYSNFIEITEREQIYGSELARLQQYIVISKWAPIKDDQWFFEPAKTLIGYDYLDETNYDEVYWSKRKT